MKTTLLIAFIAIYLLSASQVHALTLWAEFGQPDYEVSLQYGGSCNLPTTQFNINNSITFAQWDGIDSSEQLVFLDGICENEVSDTYASGITNNCFISTTNYSGYPPSNDLPEACLTGPVGIDMSGIDTLNLILLVFGGLVLMLFIGYGIKNL